MSTTKTLKRLSEELARGKLREAEAVLEEWCINCGPK